MHRALSWTLSIAFHILVAAALFHTVHMAPLELKDVMEVDLTEMETPTPVAALPIPQAVPAPEPAQPEAPIAAAPLPTDKTVVLADEPPESIAPAKPAPAPEPEPDVVKISPAKTLPPEERPDSDRIDVRKNDFIVSRGHEARFGRSMMADYYSYSSKEFSGQFRTRDDRVITIIDARNTEYGRFLIYDSKNKTLRRLKQAMGKYVYTIGPSVYEDEPISGSVTFLAKDDRIERFILQTDDDRLAHYPRKVHVREEDVSFAGAAGELHGHTSLPPYGEGHTGVVFLHGNSCEESSMVKGFTRALSMHNLASVSFMPRGCEAAEPSPGTMGELNDDIGKAMDYLGDRPQVNQKNIGIWGNGPGVVPAIEAANNPNHQVQFLVCLLNDSVDPKDMPDRNTLANLPVSTLWLITGRDTGKWRPFITQLESLRDKSKLPFSIIIAPLKASRDVLDIEGDESVWVEQVTEDHAQLAISWIDSIRK